jgi:hypothetical protein
VYNETEHYGRVNYFWHGAKRVPVAFLPFGVAAVNFVSTSRLVGNMLRDTGMLGHVSTEEAGLKGAGKSFRNWFPLDNISELYQFTTAGAVIAGVLLHTHVGL